MPENMESRFTRIEKEIREWFKEVPGIDVVKVNFFDPALTDPVNAVVVCRGDLSSEVNKGLINKLKEHMRLSPFNTAVILKQHQKG